jgi:HEAT repeat protein
MTPNRDYLSRLPLRVPPVVRRRAERALELGLIDPSNYLHAALSLEPIVDVMRDEDAAMRIAMIALLTDRGDAEAAAMLTHLTHDPDDYVRTHAAQGLERVHARHRRLIHEALDRAETEPSGGARWAELASAYLAMARLRDGVPVLCDYYLQHASTALERALQLEPRVEWLMLQAELQHLGRQWADAESTARLALEREPLEQQALLLLAELAFQRGLYEHVQQYCRRLAGLPRLAPEVMDVVSVWVDAVGRAGTGG